MAHYWISGAHLQFKKSIERLIPFTKKTGAPSWKIFEKISKFPRPIPSANKTPKIRRLRRNSLLLNWPGRGVFWIRTAERQVQYDLKAVRSPELFWDVMLGPIISYLLML